jgi:hypothetical protein
MNAAYRALATLALASFASGACATAQPAGGPGGPAGIPELRVGASVSGSLTAADPAMSDRGPFKVYRFQAQDGQRYIAHLRSEDFDAFLTLMRPVGSITEALNSDDDGGQGTDSRLRFRVPAPGTYYLVAQSLGEDGTGAFTLSLELAPAPVVAVPQPIALGQTVQGTLTEEDAMVDEDDWDPHYKLYTIQARAGQQLMITMESDEFDTYIGFGPMTGGELQVTDYDDDGGDGTNSRLRVTVPGDGTYGVQARAFGPGHLGRYTLTVREQVPAPVTTRPIRAGTTVNAALTTADAELDEGNFYQHWTYAGRAGETVRIRMRSDEFDTYLYLGQLAGGTFREMAYNDDAEDGDDGTNSYLEFTLPAAGEYVIRATSFSGGSTGSYTLRVDSSQR